MKDLYPEGFDEDMLIPDKPMKKCYYCLLKKIYKNQLCKSCYMVLNGLAFLKPKGLRKGVRLCKISK
jgi:predicted thioredoxin/glutaredoxin